MVRCSHALLPRKCLRDAPTPSARPPLCKAFIAILFSLFLRFLSSASHKWQNSHSAPDLHPTSFQKKAQGLQAPWKCNAEPLLPCCGPTSSASASGRGVSRWHSGKAVLALPFGGVGGSALHAGFG